MTQTALDEFALSQGISKTTADMTEAEKTALRYKFVIQQLGTASGDFARTSDGWANQMRILNLQFDSFKANIGQGLINVLTPAIKAINALMEKLVQLSAKFKEFTELITGKTSDSSGTGSTASDLAGIKDSADDVKDSAKKAKEEIRSLMGFDQINKLSDTEEEKDAGIDIGSGLGSAAGQADKTGSAIDKLKDKIKSLFDLFKKGFDLGFADADLENLLKQARRVRDALEAIFTDPRVVNAAKGLGKQIVETLGVITGSIARVAVEWGAAILAGIADSLEKNRGYIVSKLTEILNTTTEIVDQIGRIFLTLADILTAPQVLESLRGLSESITTFLITATLSITDIATKYGLAIITGIADSLEENKESISDKLSGILDNCSRFFDDLSLLFDSLDYIFTAPEALENLRQLSSDITTILTELTLTALEIVTGFGTDLMELIITPIVDNKEKIQEAFNGTLEVIASVVGTIEEFVTNTCEKITELYDEHIKPFMDSLKDGISEIGGTLLDGYNEYIVPVLEGLADKFEDVMENHVQPMMDSFIDVLGKITDALKSIWEETIQPFIDWIAENIMPALSPIVECIGETFLGALEKLADGIKVVVEKLGEFATWCSDNQDTIVTITEVVTGFFAAWEVIKLMAFIEQSGGVLSAFQSLLAPITSVTTALIANSVEWAKNMAAKIADKAETIALTAMYAKDFVVSVASGTAALVKQAAQFVITTAAKVADTAAQIAMTAATIAWNAACAIATTVTTAFGAAVAFLTSPIGLVIIAITALVAAGVLLYKNWDKVKAKAKSIWEGIKNTIGKVIDSLKDKFNSFKSFVGSIFDKIGEKVGGVWDKIGNGAKSAMNVVIGALNTLIDGLNMIDVPDSVPVLGGIGNIPHIPKLAEGGYVKANTPRLAVIGDNTRYGEIVSPENKLLEMAKMAAQMSGGGNNAELLAILKEILNFLRTHEIVEIDPEALRKWFIKKTNQNTMATGNPELIT